MVRHAPIQAKKRKCIIFRMQVDRAITNHGVF
jgi:hypothetical protein